MWWFGLAMATSPLWNGDVVRIMGSPHGDPGAVSVQTDAGTILVGPDRIQTYDADRTVQIQPLSWPAPFDSLVYNLIRAPGCDLDGDGVGEVAYAHSGGDVDLRDPFSGAIVASLAAHTQVPRLERLLCADIDGDGQTEILGAARQVVSRHVWEWEADGTIGQRFTLQGGEFPLTVLQADNDPALEVVLPNHRVVDGATWSTEGQLDRDIDQLRIADIDGDGIDERLEARGTRWTLPSYGIDIPDAQDAIMGDFDGDGAFEIVYDIGISFNPYWTTHHVVDVATGLERHPPSRGRACMDDWETHDHDGDGVVELICRARNNDQAVFDPVLGERVMLRGQHHRNVEPHSGDLDGDGVDEVVWVPWTDSPYADRIVIRDLEGELIDIVPMEDPHAVRPMDLDADGVAELVQGNLVWNWSPGTLTARPALFANVSSGEITVAAGDFDGDGDLDVLLEEFVLTSEVYTLLDTGTGLRRSLGALPFIHALDLDGDGLTEILTPRAIHDGAGNTLTTLSRSLRPTTVGNQTFLVHTTGSPTMSVYRWTGQRVRSVTRFTLPQPVHGFVGYRNGRIWVREYSDLIGWSPLDGSVVVHPDAAVGVIIGDLLWRRSDDQVWGYRL